MKLVPCILLALAAFSTAEDVRVVNDSPSEVVKDSVVKFVESDIIQALEDLREIILNGNEDVPVLDPFHLSELSLDLSAISKDLGVDGVSGQIHLNNIRSTGLGAFLINTISFSLLLRRIDFDLSIPELIFSSESYDLDVTVDQYKFNGNGDGKFTLYGLGISGRVRFTYSILGGGITISEVTTTIRLDSVKSEITGLLGNSPAGYFINSIIEVLIPQLVVVYANNIATFVNQVIMDLANELLRFGDLNIARSLFQS